MTLSWDWNGAVVNTPLLGELVRWLQRTSTFPRVHREVYSQLFTATRELHKLDSEAIEHCRAVDEMAYFRFDPIDLKIQSLWMSAAPWVRVSAISLSLISCVFLFSFLPSVLPPSI